MSVTMRVTMSVYDQLGLQGRPKKEEASFSFVAVSYEVTTW